MRRLRRHPIACYLAVTFGVTWSAWLGLALLGRDVTIGLTPLYLVGLLGPAAGAVVTTAIVAGHGGLRALVSRMVRIRAGGRWWAIGLGGPLAIGLAFAGLALLLATFGIASHPASHRWRELGAFNGFPLVSPLVLWLLLVVVNGLGEETGWRGYLLPQLQRRWSTVVASLVVGVVWCVWHVPAFFITETYRAMPPAMIPMFFLGVIAGSVFLGWLYSRGRRSILLVAVAHATYNWLSGSVGARGALAAIESTAIMAVAIILVLGEVRSVWREDHAAPGVHQVR